jgi:hypothetical protein
VPVLHPVAAGLLQRCGQDFNLIFGHFQKLQRPVAFSRSLPPLQWVVEGKGDCHQRVDIHAGFRVFGIMARFLLLRDGTNGLKHDGVARSPEP